MVKNMLSLVPIFSELDDSALEKIASRMQKRTYPKDKIILMEEDEGDTFFVLDKGSVKITRISEDGREIILSILHEGDFFGEMTIFDGEARSANVVSLEETEVFILRRPDFLEILKQYPQISIHLLQELAGRLRKSDALIESLSLGDAEKRIGLTLLRIAEDQGIYKSGDVHIEKLPYQQDIANMAGTSRETVSRTLKLFEDRGIIEKEGHKLVMLGYEDFKKSFS